MTEAQARARLEKMVASTSEPTLSSAEIDELLVLARIADADRNPPYVPRRTSTAYGVGEYVVPDPRNGHRYKVTVAGTSHASSTPSWPLTSGATVTDGSVTWQEDGLAPWSPTYDLNIAAAEGWRWKAGKQAAVYGFRQDDQESNREQIYQQCLSQAEEYTRKIVGSIEIPTPLEPWQRVSTN